MSNDEGNFKLLAITYTEKHSSLCCLATSDEEKKVLPSKIVWRGFDDHFRPVVGNRERRKAVQEAEECLLHALQGKTRKLKQGKPY